MRRKINNKNNEVKFVVGRSFIRVVKNHHFYHIFKSRFDKMANRDKSERTPFGRYDDFDSLMTKIEEFTLSQNSHPRDKYEHITMMINHMLHFFLEQGGVDARRLGMYGQEIFDIACYALFGDDYIKDMDSMNHSAPKPTTDLEAYLVGEFMKLRNGGHDISWEDFINKFMPHIDKAQFNERNYHDNRVDNTSYEDDDYYYDEDEDDEDEFPF